MVPTMVDRASVLAWEVPPDREEPWRRFLQEISGPRREDYAKSRRRLGISAESIWLVSRPSGGGVAVIYLEAQDPNWALDRALREFAASGDPFDSWYRMQMRELFGCDFARPPRVPGGELLFGWREVPGEGDPELQEGS